MKLNQRNLNMKLLMHRWAWLLGVMLALSCGTSVAETRILILDFELNDIAGITPTPNEELERTASLGPLLRDAIAKNAGYKILPINKVEQAKANAGFGYLLDHSDEAAKLGQQSGADFVVVGQIHKPSFLFAYLRIHLVDANSGKLVGNHYVEIKGSTKKVTEKGVANLANYIDETLRNLEKLRTSTRFR